MTLIKRPRLDILAPKADFFFLAGLIGVCFAGPLIFLPTIIFAPLIFKIVAVAGVAFVLYCFYWTQLAPELNYDNEKKYHQSTKLVKQARNLIKNSPLLKSDPTTRTVPKILKNNRVALFHAMWDLQKDTKQGLRTTDQLAKQERAINEDLATMMETLEALRRVDQEHRSLLDDQATLNKRQASIEDARTATSTVLRELNDQAKVFKEARNDLNA